MIRYESQLLQSEESTGGKLRRNSSIGQFKSVTASPLTRPCMFAGLFNDDDIMLGNFDEDGSFIGDYTQNSQVESQAVQNKLLFFANFPSKDL